MLELLSSITTGFKTFSAALQSGIILNRAINKAEANRIKSEWESVSESLIKLLISLIKVTQDVNYEYDHSLEEEIEILSNLIENQPPKTSEPNEVFEFYREQLLLAEPFIETYKLLIIQTDSK